MKLFQKKKNNKGFSLVELIVVVAIMAVLLGVLVPTLVRYVEKTKVQKDESAVEEIRAQFQTTLADPAYSDIGGTVSYNTDGTINITAGTPSLTGADDATIAAYLKEVSQNLDGKDTYTFNYTSKAHKSATTVFTITNQTVEFTITD